MAGFSDGVELGGHGLIKQDSTVVMRVEVGKEYRGRQAPALHWRGVAFDNYKSGRWSRSRRAPRTNGVTEPGVKTTTHHLLYDVPKLRRRELHNRIDGAFTHAVRKSPRFSGADEEVSDGMALTGQELAFGERVMSLVEGDLLYGRVDIMQEEDGAPRLSELELMEPSLFLCQSPAALNRYVNAIVKALGTPPGVAGPETA